MVFIKKYLNRYFFVCVIILIGDCIDELIKNVENYVKKKSDEYLKNSDDKYDFWNEHMKYVYYEAQRLAQEYGANLEIVKLGALLHDIALIEDVGSRADHHINGKKLSNDILEKFDCPADIKERVLGCVLNHRSSKNATNDEELCVCDADILAHFANLPMLFYSAFTRYNIDFVNIREWIKTMFEKDYNDLSDRTKKEFSERYELIKDIIINDLNI